MSRRLALFDLDNTLLSGDSDHCWGEFLIARGIVDGPSHRQANDRFYEDYLEQKLDIQDYVQFTLAPILDMPAAAQQQLIDQYVAEEIGPMMTDKSRQLIAEHRAAGDYCIIITATNAFITRPIATAFGIETLLATELVHEKGRLTGRIAGTPCYQEGKVIRLREWLSAAADAGLGDLSLHQSIFYSDSCNDLPLLELVTEPVAVDADDRLRGIAGQRGWREMSLRD